MDYKDLLQTHFNLEITELSLLDSHFRHRDLFGINQA